MDGLIIAFASVLFLIGAVGLFHAATGRPTHRNAITRVLFSVRGRAQSRAALALSSAAAIVLAGYLLLTVFFPALPLWPSIIAIALFAVLQMLAHLKRDGIY